MPKGTKKRKAGAKRKLLIENYPYTVLITLAALLLSLFVILSQSQKTQEQRTRAQSSSCDISAADMAIEFEEQKMLDLINDYREVKGVSSLTKSDNLTRMAAWMSKDMSVSGKTDHKDSLNRTPEERAIACGSAYGAENIASGFTTTEATLNFWKSSPDHEFNLSDPKYTVFGVAKSGSYWTVVFAQNDEVPVVSVTQGAVSPTNVVPSPECLGACVTISPTTLPTQIPITITGSVSPTDTPLPSNEPEPTQSVAPTPGSETPGPGTGGGGIIELFLQFLKLIIEFFLSLLK